MSSTQVIEQTENWLTSFIIKYNICPFAKSVHEQDSIHYSVIESSTTGQCLENVFNECLRLDTDKNIETTLIIYPNNFCQFNDYLDFLELAESLLIEQNYEGTYQLASFHPNYCFEGESPTDPANYTNRSPYPMLHLIRETSLEKALQTFPHPESIPERNMTLLKQLGLEKIQSILQLTK